LRDTASRRRRNGTLWPDIPSPGVDQQAQNLGLTESGRQTIEADIVPQGIPAPAHLASGMRPTA